MVFSLKIMIITAVLHMGSIESSSPLTTTQPSAPETTTQSSTTETTTQPSTREATTQLSTPETTTQHSTAQTTTQPSTPATTTQHSAPETTTQPSTTETTTQPSTTEATTQSSTKETTTQPLTTESTIQVLTTNTLTQTSTTEIIKQSEPSSNTTAASRHSGAIRMGSDTCELIPVAVIVSFIGGMLVMVLVWVILKVRRERKWCFKEKEEPVRAKWEGASDKITTKVIRQHTLERLNQIDILADSTGTTGQLNITMDDPVVKEVAPAAVENIAIIAGDEGKPAGNVNDHNSEQPKEDIKLEEQNVDNAEKGKGIDEPDTVGEKQKPEQQNERDSVQKIMDTKDAETGGNREPTKPETEVLLNVKANDKVLNETSGKDVNSSDVRISIHVEEENATPADDQIFEYDRGSTASVLGPSDSQDFFILENENFRNSKVSING